LASIVDGAKSGVNVRAKERKSFACGRQKDSYGKYSLPKTYREFKYQYDDPYAQEECVNVKMRKRVNSAYSYADYYYTHNDKSWKTQSKRKRQYK